KAAAASVLLHKSLSPPGDLLGWYVLLMRSDPPLIANRVLDAGVAVPIELIRWLTRRGCARLQRALVHGVHIVHVEVKRAKQRLTIAHRFAHHDERVTDPDLGMHDGAIRPRHAVKFLSPESLLQKIEQFGGPWYDQKRSDTVIAVRNWFDCHWYCLLYALLMRDTTSYLLFLAELHMRKGY